MLLTTSLIAAALQVGPNPNALPPINAHDELRNRPEREESADPVNRANPTSIWLAECLAQLEEDPSRAHSQAQIRLTEAVGADAVIANHCLGLAATELGLWEDARTAFQNAKEGSPDNDKRARARFGTMAGNAAIAGGNAQLAVTLLKGAEEDARIAASATLEALAATDKALALVALDRRDEALDALETATRLEPGLPEGWLLKATLLRRLDRVSEAQPAIERASALAPLDGRIGLEAGVIAVLSGREDAARKSWQSVIDTASDTLAAEQAQRYLAQLGAYSTSPNAEPQP